MRRPEDILLMPIEAGTVYLEELLLKGGPELEAARKVICDAILAEQRKRGGDPLTLPATALAKQGAEGPRNRRERREAKARKRRR